MRRATTQLAGPRREQNAVLCACLGHASRLALEGQHAQRDLGGEVLVGDRDVAALPEVADEPQRGGDDLVVDLRHAQLGVDRLADHDLGCDLVAGEQRDGECAAELADARLGGVVHGDDPWLPFLSRFPRPVGHCKFFAFERGTR